MRSNQTNNKFISLIRDIRNQKANGVFEWKKMQGLFRNYHVSVVKKSLIEPLLDMSKDLTDADIIKQLNVIRNYKKVCNDKCECIGYTEQECIAFLKAHGYKIYKQQLVEV